MKRENEFWTFGIVCGSLNENLKKSIESIEKMNIPKDKHEILLCVDTENDVIDIGYKNVIANNNTGKVCYSIKKNALIRSAKFNNIALLHDYIAFEENWYNNFLNFEEDWNVCSTQIRCLSPQGRRDADWVITVEDAPWTRVPHALTHFVLPYEVRHLTYRMWLSGHFFCVRKDFIEKHGLWLNESLCRFDIPPEDQEWSNRVKKITNFSMNDKSIAYATKDHPGHNLPLISDYDLKRFL